MKANESYLYPLDKSFLFIPKPPTLIAHSEIASVTFSRVGSGITNTRTFEMKFNMKNGVDYQFGGINRLVYIYVYKYINKKYYTYIYILIIIINLFNMYVFY